MKKRQMIPALLTLLCLALALTGCGGVKRVTNETEDVTLGVDVARYQGTINWRELAGSGLDFAMVRLGYRSSADGAITEDSNARYNLQQGSKAGIALGAYFFSTAISEEEAREEAAWVAELLAPYPITYPVAYDCEGYHDPDSRQYLMTAKERTDVALAFLKELERRGYEGMFYGSKNDLESSWETERIEKHYKIWVAQYPDPAYPQTPQSDYTGTHHMWQFSKEGAVVGISQLVDLNVAYFGYDGIEPAHSDEVPEEVGPDVEAMMDFEEVNEQVTAKDETNLRDIPSQDELSTVLYTLQNGEVATRVAVSPSGWSKLIYQDQVCYAVSSYLTTDLNYDPAAAAQDPDGDGIQTQFEAVDYEVTAKDVVNLRSLPSVEREDVVVLGQLENGDTARCTGVSDNGWSRLEYNGQTCYAVTSYLQPLEGQTQTEPQQDAGIQTQFEEVSDQVTAKEAVNLRSLPSVEDPDCVVVATLVNGEVVTRTGINRDLGWSRVEYNGQTLYCISSYLEEVS